MAAGLDGERLAVEAFEALPGRGVRGVIAGRPLMLANHRWIEELGLCSSALEASMQVHERQGRSLSLLADDSGVLALIAVADTVRPSSAAAMEALRALGVTPVMLTGDNAATAGAIAALAGIDAGEEQPAAPGQARSGGRSAGPLWIRGHGWRWHQRCAGPGPGGHRLCDGGRRHPHRHRSRRCGDHERRSDAGTGNDRPLSPHLPHPAPEHRAGAGNQGHFFWCSPWPGMPRCGWRSSRTWAPA